MRRREGIKLQKKVHRIIYVRDITFLAAGPPYVIFLSLFLSTRSLSSTPISKKKRHLMSQVLYAAQTVGITFQSTFFYIPLQVLNN